MTRKGIKENQEQNKNKMESVFIQISWPTYGHHYLLPVNPYLFGFLRQAMATTVF
jgi:hypothetical protein